MEAFSHGTFHPYDIAKDEDTSISHTHNVNLKDGVCSSLYNTTYRKK